MMAMLTAIAAEGADESPEANARMNAAITKFIGVNFITKAVLLDQGFDEPTATSMANALTNTEEGGEQSQTAVLEALGLTEK